MILNNLMKLPIIKRIIPSILKLNIRLTGSYKKETIVEGVLLNLDLRHLIDRRVFLHKGYEDELYFKLVDVIKKNQVDFFLDIGSCWGIYSLRLAKRFKNLKILAFDPIKLNIGRLRQSIKKNKFKNIKIFHTALGNDKGVISLGTNENFSPNYQINNKNPVIIEKSKINLIDNLITFKKRILVLKIDVESFEVEVLKGAKKLLMNNNCFVQIEIIRANMEEVVIFLKKIGYQLISKNTHNKTDYLFSNFLFETVEV
jgi:FkbM family methyltransferase